MDIWEPLGLKDDPLKHTRGRPFTRVLPFLFGPMWPTPLTDLTAPLFTAQEGPVLCANMEMMMLNCLDQYGYNRGLKMCGGYIQDLEECRMKRFERTRVQIMMEERRRQYRDGKLKEKYEECPPHI